MNVMRSFIGVATLLLGSTVFAQAIEIKGLKLPADMATFEAWQKEQKISCINKRKIRESSGEVCDLSGEFTFAGAKLTKGDARIRDGNVTAIALYFRFGFYDVDRALREKYGAGFSFADKARDDKGSEITRRYSTWEVDGGKISGNSYFFDGNAIFSFDTKQEIEIAKKEKDAREATNKKDI